MNPLLAQFMIEARDLLDDAVQGLLRMERGEGGAEVVNTVFRAVHTLKGTSGLFEMAPLTMMVHGGEDLLDAVRAGRLGLTGAMVDQLLLLMDQTRSWIEVLETNGELPAGADVISATRAAALRAMLVGAVARVDAPAAAAAAAVMAGPPAWVLEMPKADRVRAEQAARAADRDLVAIDYRPDMGCFFSGEDPLQLVRQVPELAAVEMRQPPSWPPIEGFDPYDCLLSFRLLSTAPLEELRHLFRYSEATQIVAYAPAAGAAPEQAVVVEVLTAQMRLLGRPCEPALALGRASAVAAVVRRVVLHCGGTPPDEALAVAVAQAGAGDPASLLALVQAQAALHVRTEAAEPVHEPEVIAAVESKPAGPATLRVDQARIDALMNLIGELIVAKNSLSYLARKAEAGASAQELARDIKDQQAVVNRLAEEMQSAIMAIRMMPVSHVFQRFPRLVRDISRKLDKQVALELQGEETEADKNMIEALADPLMHMVRNSLDHGLEPPAERIAAGKTAHGTILLSAEQANESIVVTIRDDGRGIDPVRIRAKAVERGMLNAEAAAAMPDSEALRLVFAAGFSTAEQISDLSGRGVGMDVVRSAVERAGGRVELDSKVGEGTTVRVTLPLTMAVTRIMTIECGGHLFGIPMNAVVESVRLRPSSIRTIGATEAFVLRDRILPLLRLARVLELPLDAAADPGTDVSVLVLRTGQATVGLVIDAFRERMEAIVRPLEGVMAGLACFVGTTMLGDGRVLLILNVAELT